MSEKIDYLTEDKSLPNQKFVCLSFLSPEGVSNCKIRGLKVRGVYDTYEEASDRAKHLRDLDKYFHVHRLNKNWSFRHNSKTICFKSE